MTTHSTFPAGWTRETLGETCDILAGFGFPERLQGKTDGDLAFFKVGDISEAWKRGDVYLSKANHYISRDEAASIRATPLPRDTTVFAKIGAAIALNRRAILTEPSLVDNNVMGLHPATSDLDAKYLFHFVCTLKLDELSRATTVPSVRKSDIESIAIPVAPLPEQRRIVAEIEKQFTRLEAGVAALRRVQANLHRYRAAVLKAACEGKLVPTEAERQRQRQRQKTADYADYADKKKKTSAPSASSAVQFETGAQLLQRILKQRRDNWTGKSKYKEPAAPDTTGLPELPEGWCWATVEQLGDVQLGRQRSPKNRSKKYPTKYLRAANITEKGIDLSDVLDMEFTPNEKPRYELHPGDLILSEASGSPDQVGKPAVCREEHAEYCFQNTVIRHRPAGMPSDYLLTTYKNYYFNGVFAKVAGGVGINHLSAAKFSKVCIPLPPVAEQERIVAEVERRLSVVEELSALVTANLQRATRLRQSILQKAFTGQL